MPTLIRFAPAVAIAALVSGCRPSSAPALAPLTLPFAVDSQRTASPRPGIVHRFVYASAGPWAINILEGHANRCWSLAALKSSGEAVGRERTSQLARTATEREPIAGAVNADFFSFTPAGVPVGFLVVDGRLIAGPIHQPALVVDSGGHVQIGTFSTIGHVDAAGRRIPIEGWNRRSARGLSYFDNAWGARTDTASAVLEIVLSGAPDYRVAAVDTMPDGVQIPPAGAVLMLGREPSDTLRQALRAITPGTAVSVRVGIAPFFPREAVGGRPVLVRAGAIAPRLDTVGRAGFATARHPRTAAGISRDASRVWLVTVDGRQAPYSDGMTLDELARLMHALGAHEAVNLDGGGSTTMVLATDTAFSVVNRPSDRDGERPVGNAVGFVRRCR